MRIESPIQMPLQSTELQSEIDHLASVGPLKTWSIVVTILGDLAPETGMRVSSRTLAAIVAPMGISDQALRVALHRLKKDNWIESVKEGRESRYALTALGLAERQAVAERIYGRGAPKADGVALIVAPPDRPDCLSQIMAAGALMLAPRTALAPLSTALPGSDCVSVDITARGKELPPWVQTLLADQPLRQEYAKLGKAIARVTPKAGAGGRFEQTVLRILILHHWRRLQLRHSGLIDGLLGREWEGAETRELVMRALEQFPAPDLEALAALAQDRLREA